MIFMTGLLSAVTIASPDAKSTFLKPRATSDTAAAILLEIAPTSNTCSSAPFPVECETTDQAAPYLIDAMISYGVYSPPKLSALLSLIAFETGDFKYAINHYPGRAGQGTRNMQMAEFNLQYALSIPKLKAQAQAIAPSSTITGLSDAQLNAIRDLVLLDQYA